MVATAARSLRLARVTRPALRAATSGGGATIVAGTKRANPQIRLVQPGIPRRTVCAPSTLEPLAWSGPRQTSGQNGGSWSG